MTLSSAMRAIPLLVTAFCALGCPPSEEAVCDMKCECEGCSDSQYDDCLDKLDDELREAERRDCVEYWDDVMVCRDETGWCKDGHEFKDECGPEKDRLKHCVD